MGAAATWGVAESRPSAIAEAQQRFRAIPMFISQEDLNGGFLQRICSANQRSQD